MASVMTAGVAWADAPATLPVQGVLTDANGDPISDTVDVTFTLYSETEGVNVIWSETQGVDVDNGLFWVYLGAELGLDLSIFRDNSELHLGIAVGDDDEMAPIALGSAGYAGFAQSAGDSDTLGGAGPEAYTYAAGDGLALDGNTFALASATLGGLSCEIGQIAAAGTDGWGCVEPAVDTDTTLTAEEVDTIVADAGYVKAAALAPLAFSGDWKDLTGVPAALGTLSLDEDSNLAVNDNAVISSEGAWVGDPTGLVGPAGPAGDDGEKGAQGEPGPTTLEKLCEVLGGSLEGGVCKKTTNLEAGQFGVPLPAPEKPPVPASVSWSNDPETGDSKCAAALGLCTKAANAFGVEISCALSVDSGSAECTDTDTIDGSVGWPGDTDSGTARCTRLVSVCVTAYNSAGEATSCNTATAGGSAACKHIGAGEGWDEFAVWLDSESGDSACAKKNSDCTLAFNSNGEIVNCDGITGSGTAQCLKQPDKQYVTWGGDTETGGSICAQNNADCGTTWKANGGVVSCNDAAGDGVVRCDPKKGWDFPVQWTGDTETGGSICAQNGGDCLASFNSNGNSVDCNSAEGTGTAKCINMPSDWAFTETWTGDTETGGSICAQNGAECFAAYNSNGNSVDCNSAEGTGTTKCAEQSDLWEFHVTWTGDTETGGSICTINNGDCVASYNSNGNSVDCNSAEGTGTAQCLTKTDAWDFPVAWSGDNDTGVSACTVQDAECVAEYNSNGNVVSCESVEGTGTAQCKTVAETNYWNLGVKWTGNLSGEQVCGFENALCVQSYNSSGNEVGCKDKGTGTARCKKQGG